MKPSELSKTLRRIASKIDGSKRPDRNLVSRDLKRILSTLRTSNAGMVDKTIADLVNDGLLEEAIQFMIKDENDFASSALERKTQGRPDRMDPDGPERAAGNPIKLIGLDLEDRDAGSATFSGLGVGTVEVPFSAEDVLSEWWHDDVMPSFHEKL